MYCSVTGRSKTKWNTIGKHGFMAGNVFCRLPACVAYCVRRTNKINIEYHTNRASIVGTREQRRSKDILDPGTYSPRPVLIGNNDDLSKHSVYSFAVLVGYKFFQMFRVLTSPNIFF
jgi:hypothetical protein